MLYPVELRGLRSGLSERDVQCDQGSRRLNAKLSLYDLICRFDSAGSVT